MRFESVHYVMDLWPILRLRELHSSSCRGRVSVGTAHRCYTVYNSADPGATPDELVGHTDQASYEPT